MTTAIIEDTMKRIEQMRDDLINNMIGQWGANIPASTVVKGDLEVSFTVSVLGEDLEMTVSKIFDSSNDKVTLEYVLASIEAHMEEYLERLGYNLRPYTVHFVEFERTDSGTKVIFNTTPIEAN